MIKKKGFTLVEITIVVSIIGILLYITFSLGFGYIDTMRLKADKETMISVVTKALATARTSNYYDSTLYTELEISFTSDGVSTYVQWGQVIGQENLDTYTLNHGNIEIPMTGSVASLLVSPYKIGCELEIDDVPITGSLDLTLYSTINSDIYCYSVSEDVCKFNQVLCP